MSTRSSKISVMQRAALVLVALGLVLAAVPVPEVAASVLVQPGSCVEVELFGDGSLPFGTNVLFSGSPGNTVTMIARSGAAVLIAVEGGGLSSTYGMNETATLTESSPVAVTFYSLTVSSASDYARVRICSDNVASPTPGSPTATRTSTRTPTPSNTPTPTNTGTATPSPTITNTPTRTRQPLPTVTRTPLPSATGTATTRPTRTPPPTWPPPPTAVPPTVTPTYAPTSENPPNADCEQYNIRGRYVVPGTVTNGSVVRFLSAFEPLERLEIRQGAILLASLGIGETWTYSGSQQELQFSRSRGWAGDDTRFEICSSLPQPTATNPPNPPTATNQVTNTPPPTGTDPCRDISPTHYSVSSYQIAADNGVTGYIVGLPGEFVLFWSSSYSTNVLQLRSGSDVAGILRPYPQSPYRYDYVITEVVNTVQFTGYQTLDDFAIIYICYPDQATPTATTTRTATVMATRTPTPQLGDDPTVPALGTATAEARATGTAIAQETATSYQATATNNPIAQTATAFYAEETATAGAPTATNVVPGTGTPTQDTGVIEYLCEREPCYSVRMYGGAVQTALAMMALYADPDELPPPPGFIVGTPPPASAISGAACRSMTFPTPYVPFDTQGAIDVDENLDRMHDGFCEFTELTYGLRQMLKLASRVLIVLGLFGYFISLARRLGDSGGG